MTSNTELFFQALRDFEEILDAPENLGEIVSAGQKLVEIGFPEQELLHRSEMKYLRNWGNRPGENKKNAQVVTHENVVEVIADIGKSWELAKDRIKSQLQHLEGFPLDSEIVVEAKTIEKIADELARFSRDLTFNMRDFPRILSPVDRKFCEGRHPASFESPDLGK